MRRSLSEDLAGATEAATTPLRPAPGYDYEFYPDPTGAFYGRGPERHRPLHLWQRGRLSLEQWPSLENRQPWRRQPQPGAGVKRRGLDSNQRRASRGDVATPHSSRSVYNHSPTPSFKEPEALGFDDALRVIFTVTHVLTQSANLHPVLGADVRRINPDLIVRPLPATDVTAPANQWHRQPEFVIHKIRDSRSPPRSCICSR